MRRSALFCACAILLVQDVVGSLEETLYAEAEGIFDYLQTTRRHAPLP